MQAVAQPPRPLELRAQHGEPYEHDEQPRPRDEREREDQADADERQAEHDAARADGVPEHRGAGSVARGALWRHRRPGMVGRRMIPLRDNIPSARVPIVNYAIITANVLVFCYEF